MGFIRFRLFHGDRLKNQGQIEFAKWRGANKICGAKAISLMNKFWTCFYFFTAISTCFGQPARLELLSRSDDHARRKGGAAASAVPEFSRDGNFVLFLSQAGNLTTNVPVGRALNLYMVDRRTLQTTLVSQGVDGAPANSDVLNFEISADNRRVLIETAASNMIANDTNNAPDVFVRDLDLKTNILVSVNTSGGVARGGARDGTMSADGNGVAFLSSDRSLATGQSVATTPVYVRNIAAGTTEMLKPPVGNTLLFTSDPAISGDGHYAIYNATTMTGTSTYLSMNVLCDLQTHTNIQMAAGISGNVMEAIMTPDGKFVTFGIINSGSAAVTNLIARYSTETGTTDLVVSNNVLRALTRPAAISDDGQTILYLDQNGYRVYREGLETRVFPKASDGSAMALPTVFGMAAMSADGKFVTFSTSVPLLATDGDASQFRTYIYDVEQDTLAEIPLSLETAPPSDPVPNADGSAVVFTAASAGIQDESEPATLNVYLWQRASGEVTLLSQSHVGAFENTSYSDSKLPETGAFSDDGQKMVFASRAPASGIADENGAWDVFVLDRATGQKQLVSVSADGQSTGSGASMQPIISGNGQFVAFVSSATNLVAVDTQGRLELYVRDVVNGVTRLVRNKDGGAPSRGPAPGSLSFSADGKLLCFASAAVDLDARDSQPQIDVFVYDTASDSVTLASYDASNTTGANANCVNPLISPNGKYVAFRTTASNLSIGTALNYPIVRNLQTGVLRRPELIGFGSVDFKLGLRFNPTSTTLYFCGTGPSFYSFAVTNATSTSGIKQVTSAIQGFASADGKWIAFTRRITSPLSTQVYLRNVTNGVELCISSNVTAAAIGNDNSSRPQISADGRFTIFESRASNLVANDTNAATDLFIYDRDQQRLDLLSAKTDGSVANGFSMRGVISPDQSFVAFVSFASDLVPHDYNEGADIFAAYLPAPDTDGDGIDDRWEMAQFGTLDHDMTQDTDGDGLSDAAEFQAQTDPNEAGSSLRVVSASVDAGQNVVLRWASIPGRAYRVQARSRFDVESAWQDVSDAVISSTTESAFTLPSIASANELYFRVVSAD
jgi:Tol biopolymer transport system component